MGLFSWLFGSKNDKKTENLAQYDNISLDGVSCIFLDIETTGVSAENDDILQLSMIDDNARVLFCEYFRPVKKSSWKDAERVNGISPKMVANKPTFADRLYIIQGMLDKVGSVGGYNVGFDLKFLTANGVYGLDSKHRVDVMYEFSNKIGRRVKLVEAAKFFNYTFPAHDALADIQATLVVHNALARYKSPQAERNVDGLWEHGDEEYLNQIVGDKTIREIQKESYEEYVNRNFSPDTPEYMGLHIFSNTYPPKENYAVLNDGEKQVFVALVKAFEEKGIEYDKIRMLRYSSGELIVEHPSCFAARIRVNSKESKYDIYPIGKSRRKRVAKSMEEANEILASLGDGYEIRERKFDTVCNLMICSDKIKEYSDVTLEVLLKHIPEVATYIKRCMRY